MTTASGIPAILAGTKPWVRLVSILGFISAGLMILLGIGVAGLGLFQRGAPEFVAIGMIYPITGLLYLVPSFYLFRYASRIEDYVRGGQDMQLELALDSQRAFWKFVASSQ